MRSMDFGLAAPPGDGRIPGKRLRGYQALVGVLHLTVALTAVAAGDVLREVRVSSVRRVFHNGEHNAFTAIYLAGLTLEEE